MINPKTRIAALVMTIALAFGGCSLFKSSSAPNDGAIVSSIQSKLYQDPVLKTRDVRVLSQQGVVVLSGTVASDQEKSAVEQFAQSADGVKQVIDQLVVNPSQQAATQAPAPPAQPEQRASRRRSRAAAQNEAPAPAPQPAPVVQAPPAAAQAPEEPPPPPEPYPVTVPAGTRVTVRLVDSVDSSVNQVGDEVAATVDAPISENGQIIIPRYAKARLRLVGEKSAGRIKGQSEVQLQLVGVTVNGQSYPVNSGVYQQQATSSRGKQTAERVGIGAAVGGLIGAIAGGGKGAAIGAGVGAGAGTGVQMATKGQAVKIPPETQINFTLSSPLNIMVNP
ncbi:MAG TPA: BON domain-containing protein [Terriglobia bacterium]|nr:BON domain-containing protein [Terriglobia bacterium]